MEDLFNYYGIDWLAMALSLLAVYMLGNKNKLGFIVFIISNIMWMVLGLTLMKSYGVAAGNFVFIIINTKGFIQWNKQNKAVEN